MIQIITSPAGNFGNRGTLSSPERWEVNSEGVRFKLVTAGIGCECREESNSEKEGQKKVLVKFRAFEDDSEQGWGWGNSKMMMKSGQILEYTAGHIKDFGLYPNCSKSLLTEL